MDDNCSVDSGTSDRPGNSSTNAGPGFAEAETEAPDHIAPVHSPGKAKYAYKYPPLPSMCSMYGATASELGTTASSESANKCVGRLYREFHLIETGTTFVPDEFGLGLYDDPNTFSSTSQRRGDAQDFNGCRVIRFFKWMGEQADMPSSIMETKAKAFLNSHLKAEYRNRQKAANRDVVLGNPMVGKIPEVKKEIDEFKKKVQKDRHEGFQDIHADKVDRLTEQEISKLVHLALFPTPGTQIANLKVQCRVNFLASLFSQFISTRRGEQHYKQCLHQHFVEFKEMLGLNGDIMIVAKTNGSKRAAGIDYVGLVGHLNPLFCAIAWMGLSHVIRFVGNGVPMPQLMDDPRNLFSYPTYPSPSRSAIGVGGNHYTGQEYRDLHGKFFNAAGILTPKITSLLRVVNAQILQDQWTDQPTISQALGHRDRQTQTEANAKHYQYMPNLKAAVQLGGGRKFDNPQEYVRPAASVDFDDDLLREFSEYADFLDSLKRAREKLESQKRISNLADRLETSTRMAQSILAETKEGLMMLASRPRARRTCSVLADAPTFFESFRSSSLFTNIFSHPFFASPAWTTIRERVRRAEDATFFFDPVCVNPALKSLLGDDLASQRQLQHIDRQRQEMDRQVQRGRWEQVMVQLTEFRREHEEFRRNVFWILQNKDGPTVPSNTHVAAPSPAPLLVDPAVALNPLQDDACAVRPIARSVVAKRPTKADGSKLRRPALRQEVVLAAEQHERIAGVSVSRINLNQLTDTVNSATSFWEMYQKNKSFLARCSSNDARKDSKFVVRDEDGNESVATSHARAVWFDRWSHIWEFIERKIESRMVECVLLPAEDHDVFVRRITKESVAEAESLWATTITPKAKGGNRKKLWKTIKEASRALLAPDDPRRKRRAASRGTNSNKKRKTRESQTRQQATGRSLPNRQGVEATGVTEFMRAFGGPLTDSDRERIANSTSLWLTDEDRRENELDIAEFRARSQREREQRGMRNGMHVFEVGHALHSGRDHRPRMVHTSPTQYFQSNMTTNGTYPDSEAPNRRSVI